MYEGMRVRNMRVVVAWESDYVELSFEFNLRSKTHNSIVLNDQEIPEYSV